MVVFPLAMVINGLAAGLAAWSDGRWVPGIGDPSLLGWMTVAAYGAAAVLCALAGWQERAAHQPPMGRAWTALTLAMVALGLNKQLDLQTLFGRSAKSLVQAAGFIDYKNELQNIFIVALLILGALAVLVLLWAIRRYWRRYGLSVLGSVFLVSFVIARGSSFHDVDWFLGQTLAGASINGIMELGGIALIALNAGLFLMIRRDRAPSPPAKH